MALTESQQNTVCQILGITPSELTYQLTMLDTTFTAQREIDVEAQITLWSTGAGTKTTKIHPKESNRGVETNPYAVRADIKRNIAVLLERPDWAGSSGMQSRTMRG